MRWRWIIIGLLGALPGGQASAGAIVMGRGLGHDCYMATLSVSAPDTDKNALAVCNQAVEDAALDSYSRAASLINRADIRLRMQDYQGTLADADASIALDPGLGAAYINRGAGLIGLQRYQEALPALEKAIALNDRVQLAYFDRALVKESTGDFKGAYDDIKKALEIDPKFDTAKQELTRFSVVGAPPP
jgi:tetratricopeptide (TPR) repeat protein